MIDHMAIHGLGAAAQSRAGRGMLALAEPS